MSDSEKGFTLVEVLVSIVVLSIVSFSLLSIFSQSLRTTHDSLNQTIANQVAQNTLHTLNRRAASIEQPLKLNQLLNRDGISSTCDFCEDTRIHGETYVATIQSLSTVPGNTIEVNISVTTDRLRNPVTLKGVISNATLREPFPETAVPATE
ncbi:prepilin-type N-terminal cleavage/methylation domain-containing protein [Exiguobacterium qingdaonense]|uniref:prepilin-type N-terminal cleavage/methylation domain-containing protein n=1 Tax=Exiguobacterium qingdaonense TaxID=2751251 RepID=UPI001BE86A00|nr:prepilin-type N-terminal cleavage/methylation domain-containing protein [Exiguobacterium qingdaonense]